MTRVDLERMVLFATLALIVVGLLALPLFQVRTGSALMNSPAPSVPPGTTASSFTQVGWTLPPDTGIEAIHLAWSEARRLKDGSWILRLRLNPAARRWDDVAMTAEVVSTRPGRGPWAVEPIGEVPTGPVSGVVEFAFRTSPLDQLDQPGSRLGIRIKIDMSYRTWVSSGSRSVSMALAFPDGSGAPPGAWCGE